MHFCLFSKGYRDVTLKMVKVLQWIIMVLFFSITQSGLSGSLYMHYEWTESESVRTHRNPGQDFVQLWVSSVLDKLTHVMRHWKQMKDSNFNQCFNAIFTGNITGKHCFLPCLLSDAGRTQMRRKGTQTKLEPPAIVLPLNCNDLQQQQCSFYPTGWPIPTEGPGFPEREEQIDSY